MNLLIHRQFFNKRREKNNDHKRFMIFVKKFSSKLKTDCSSKFYFLFLSTKSNQIMMTINDAITKILFRINYDRTMTFIEIISLFRNHIEQHEKNSIIRDIFFEKLCYFLQINFQIYSIFQIFHVFNDDKMTIRKNKHFQNRMIDLFNNKNKKINLIIMLFDV